jgi:hypothetical protein
LPLLLPDRILPMEVITGCVEAITLRQNIVHNGQREVDEILLRRAIASIKKCCTVLSALVDGASLEA